MVANHTLVAAWSFCGFCLASWNFLKLNSLPNWSSSLIDCVSVLSIPNELFLWLRLPVAPVDLTHFEEEKVGCVSTVPQLIRKRQDSNRLLSDSKSHALSVYSSVFARGGCSIFVCCLRCCCRYSRVNGFLSFDSRAI